jgi:gliding motility-associated-like protein
LFKYWLSYVLLFLLLSIGVKGQTGFNENLGQWNPEVNYQADFDFQTIYIDQSGFSVLQHDNEKWISWIEEYHEHNQDLKNKHTNQQRTLRFHHVKFKFVGADFSKHRGTKTNKEYYNYYLGNDQSKWKSGVKKHTKILFSDIYANIDLEFEAIDQRFKYNFILKPGADINDINIEIIGADDFTVKPDRLTVETEFGSFSEVMPISYTIENGSRNQIQMKYKKKGDYVGFETEDKLNNRVTVIDPELIFSTYSGSSVDNFGFTATFDSSGNLYAGGIATSPTTFAGSYPTTTGAFDVTFNGGSGFEPANLPCDISISKYDATGSNLLYATYLGGSSDEYPHSLIVDENNNLIVFGTTYSGNYPVPITAPFLGNAGGTDLIVTKFNANGTDLIGSTYIGGSSNDGLNERASTRYFYADDFRGEVNLDTLGNIYVATCTRSSNFPTTLGVFQSGHKAGQDGVVFCLTPNIDRLIWSSYFGGSGTEAIYSIDVAQNGDLYVSGGTTSTDLAKTSSSVGEDYNGGRADGFLARISNNGRTLHKTAYWGTPSYDQILSLDIDKYGQIFVVGHSDGDMPVIGNVYSNDNGSQFISKFNPLLEVVELSTVYGSGRSQPDITVNAFLVDECGKIFVSGWGSSLYTGPTSPLKDMPITNNAIQKTTDGNDFHLAVFRKDAQELLYSTYFGGNRTDDHVDGGTSRFDKRGVIYQSVCSSCPPSSDGQSSKVSDFPTTTGAYSETNPSPRCSNASFKLAFGNLNRKPHLKEEIYTVNALDTISFTYTITDPDEDSIKVYFSFQDEIKDAFINRKDLYIDHKRVDANFSVNPGCEHVGDTFIIYAHAVDIGCPGSKDSLSLFRVVVLPPPTLAPPEVICLNFINQNGIKLEWEALTNKSKYFYRMYLYKVTPNGDTTIIDTIYNQGPGLYEDFDVLNPRERNYTYFLVVENLCNEKGTNSYDLSSVKEHEIPIAATYIKTVTVEEDYLKIIWLKSTESDFGHYELYKSERGKTTLTYLTSFFGLNDTVYIDEDVDINNKSYCYQVKVSDDCGHLSKLSNYGCSIVIRGESVDNGPKVKPRFLFDLNWDEYLSWAGGVEEYELLRSVDTGSLRPIVRVNSNSRDYDDSNLDFDWGGYWYSIMAYEGPGSHNATSRSNDIYLIQPPLVFVPNAFTSNGDNINDVFGWSDVFVREFEMRLYNTWGEKVFESTDKNNTWSGKYREDQLHHSNVYVWVVIYKGWDNRRYIKKGTVTIIR